jgi:hypothetical protein
MMTSLAGIRRGKAKLFHMYSFIFKLSIYTSIQIQVSNRKVCKHGMILYNNVKANIIELEQFYIVILKTN